MGDTLQARRALLPFLFNSGGRANDAAHLIIGNLEVRSTAGSEQPIVMIFGKGSKTRYCPLWPATARAIGTITANGKPDERVFLNRLNQPLTRSGIYTLVEGYGKKASAKQPSMADKKVSPRILRHTTACHLRKAGVDINTIRALARPCLPGLTGPQAAQRIPAGRTWILVNRSAPSSRLPHHLHSQPRPFSTQITPHLRSFRSSTMTWSQSRGTAPYGDGSSI
jgi:hypothetical protein